MSESGIWIIGFLVLNVVAIFIAWRVNKQLPVSNIETDENEPIENVDKNVDIAWRVNKQLPVSNIETDENEPIENVDKNVDSFWGLGPGIFKVIVSVILIILIPISWFFKLFLIPGIIMFWIGRFPYSQVELIKQHNPNLLKTILQFCFFIMALGMVNLYGSSLNIFECRSGLNEPACAISDFFTSLDGGITKIQKKQKIINEINDYQRWRDNRSR
jgi:hypothetical protein